MLIRRHLVSILGIFFAIALLIVILNYRTFQNAYSCDGIEFILSEISESHKYLCRYEIEMLDSKCQIVANHDYIIFSGECWSYIRYSFINSVGNRIPLPCGNYKYILGVGRVGIDKQGHFTMETFGQVSSMSLYDINARVYIELEDSSTVSIKEFFGFE